MFPQRGDELRKFFRSRDRLERAIHHLLDVQHVLDILFERGDLLQLVREFVVRGLDAVDVFAQHVLDLGAPVAAGSFYQFGVIFKRGLQFLDNRAERLVYFARVAAEHGGQLLGIRAESARKIVDNSGQ